MFKVLRLAKALVTRAFSLFKTVNSFFEFLLSASPIVPVSAHRAQSIIAEGKHKPERLCVTPGRGTSIHPCAA
jgi:hypothetical protein